MKAAVVEKFGSPLVVEDRPLTLPGPEQVVVEIEASGLCHTDIHAARGEWPVKPEPPFVPGHEGVGVVVRVGEGNTHGIEVGDRVAMPWLAYACGDCRYCNSGRETLCPDQQNMGYSMDGCFAELAVGNARHLVKVPDGVCPSEAAPLTCAGVTTYKAVKESGAGPASLVAVFGVGGLGHLAVQYARICGASVIAVDVSAERLEEAGTLGAEHLVNASERDPIEAITELGGADQAIVTAAAHEAGSWFLSKYDYSNPGALKRLLGQGALLRGFSPDIMHAAYAATTEACNEEAAKNPRFKKLYESVKAFRRDAYQWWQVNELSFDAFQVRMETRT